jgi:hypothetical protein
MENISIHMLWMRLNTARIRRNALWEDLSEETNKRQFDENAIENAERELAECQDMIADLEEEKLSMLKTWPIGRILAEAENALDFDFRNDLLVRAKSVRIREGLLDPIFLLNNNKTFEGLIQIHRDMIDILEFKRNYLENHSGITQPERQMLLLLDRTFPTGQIQQRLPEVKALLDDKQRERQLAFMMRTHPRLGAFGHQLDTEILWSFILNHKPY